MTRVYLVRHGENPANLLKQFSHRLVDYSLTPKGIVQAEQTAAFFRDKRIDAVYSSPLKRAFETAEIIGAALGLPVTVVEAFREINVGALEAEPPSAENWDRYFQIARDWFSGTPDTAFPEGENYHELLARMHHGLQQVIAGREGQNVVVVGHGGVFTATLKDICRNVDVQQLIGVENHNCSVSEIELTKQEGALVGELVSWASCGHIRGDAAEFTIPVPDEHRAERREVP